MQMRAGKRVSIVGVLLTLTASVLAQPPADRGAPWTHHSIDDSARGADGVRLADANGDGLLDIATGWEEAGIIRLYVNPGPKNAAQRWPAVTVGRAKSPEDAVLVDLDGDGALDIVSCCEGNTKSVFIHWSPRDKSRLLEESTWTTEPFPALAHQQLAMYCLPLQIDGSGGVDLVIGSKGPGAKIGWLQSPANPRDLAAWKYHPLCDAGWIMSLVAADIDADGDQDILASDRKGKAAGCLWLENPGPGTKQLEPWPRHAIGSAGHEVMFLHHVDFDADGQSDILVPTFDKRLFWHRRAGSAPAAWETKELPFPAAVGKGKAIRAADIDLDGRLDLILSTENFEGTSGLVWMSHAGDSLSANWLVHELSGPAGPKGMKLDDIQIIDLDADGDLDVLTTEERTGWGVVWFENPTR
jgi:FG-GAP-like repeat